ncbi:MAG TPA: hypothetical protein VHM25_22205, partial [Polyangiaceae bacterium]|nr:hypothetical protein [Polyangiaceae bacterium]
PTALFTKARTAGMIALTLVIATAGAAAPAQASQLKHSFDIEIGSGSDSRHDDCDSRREIKYFFQEEYDLRHVDVSRTHDYYIYKVSGFALPQMQPALSEISKKSDYVRYVFLFDACEHEVIKQLQPRKSVSEM